MRKLLSCLVGLVCLCYTAVSQNVEVSGKVSDDKGNPISGASVQEKSSKRGTTTDANGVFKLSTKPGTALIISSVGFDKQQVTAGTSGLVIVLAASNQALSEVVVTAMGVKREKKALGYAVSTVGKKDLELRPEADLGRILNGKAPGLNVLSTSGLSGSGTNINIRGISTITGSSDPLFVVDGVPFNSSTNNGASNFTYGTQTSSRFLDLDPNNIENVNILKGLSAVTLYGEAGRNGVILITTKNGSTSTTKKKTEISVSQSLFSTKAILPEYNTSYGGGFDLSLGLLFFSNWGAKFTNPPALVAHPYDKAALNADFPQFAGKPYEYKFYNSVPRYFRTGTSSTTAVNLGGSAGGINYNMNYSHNDDKGYLPGNRLVKNNFGVGGTAKLSNRFTISGTMNYVSTNMTSPPTSNSYGNNATNTSVFGNVMYTPTAVDLMGLPYEKPSDHSQVYYRNDNGIQNPRWTLYNSFTVDRVNRTYGQMNTKFDITKGLNITYRIGYDNYTEYQEYSQNKGGVATPTGILRTLNRTNTIWDHTAIVSFNHNLGSNFSINADAGGNVRKDLYDQTGMTSTQQLVYGVMNHANFISHTTTSENGITSLIDKGETLGLGAFATGTLAYKDYAYLTVGGRNSWKSTVEENNRSIFYPNVALSYIPTSAIPALQNNKNINYLKVRIGYSTSANFPSPYQTRTSLNVVSKYFVTASGNSVNINSIPNLLPNANLKPELLKETEAGIEGKFFNNKISLDFTMYRRVANDQILRRDLDPGTGYTAQQINAGTVTNKGIEVQLGVVAFENKDWKWELTGLYTINKSLVSNIPDYLPQVNTAGYSNEGTFAKNGYALGVIMSNYFQKDPKTGLRLVGTDGNYINSNDIGVIGDPNSLYKLTGISSLSYKSFNFRMQWDYTQGGEMFSGTAGALLGRGVTKDTQFDRQASYILPGVLENGQPNNIQISSSQAYYGNSITNGAADESAIFDATCVRLREASLSYSLPTKLLSKMPFGSVSISLSGSNLWYYAPNFPKYIHFDPEASGLGVSNGRGLEFLSGPSARRMGASIRVTF
ncbi:MAG: SusC/RagA family TonB-linked outer membrane protein [Chitinophagaceae bacterium]